MAASSKPTAVHFTLAFFVTTTLILGVVCYLNGKELSKSNADANAARDTATKNQNDFTKLLDETNSLMKLLGFSGDIGEPTDTPDQLADGTVQKSVFQALNRNGKDLVQPSPAAPNVSETLLALRTELDSKIAEVAQLQTTVKDAEARLLAETASHRQERAKIQESQMGSETQLQDKVLEQNEILKEKDDEIVRLEAEKNMQRMEKEQIKDELERVRKLKEAEIHQLTATVLFLKKKIEDIEKVSFEVPDGKVVRVISSGIPKVWINLGRLDGLRSGTGFSVYARNHNGMARDNGDIKGRIEIDLVTEDHLAEGRIISEDRARPIQEDDPIYTPLWTAGQKEAFAFVGLIDINDDGKSDREYLHSILANANAQVDFEVNDLGDRVPADGKMSVQTKYLVVGEIPDASLYPAADVARQEAIKKIVQEHKSLEEEALRTGVRVVKLSDFLTWAGVSPQERLFLPGDDRSAVLKAGAASKSVGEELGNRFSTGQVSELFNRSRNGQNSSNSQSGGSLQSR